MLASHAFDFSKRNEPTELLLEDPVAEVDHEEDSQDVLYRASFEEFSRSYVQCDTIIWVLISLLLILAWGVGLIMLLYLPVRRYVLRKDISSRKLYVTPNEIVYKVTRPSVLPFLGYAKIENHISLHLVIDVIVEQGCLQSAYGIHTVRIESIAHGKTAPVDELQFQGVSNPGLLRKVIVTEAAKCIRETASWKPKFSGEDGLSTPRMRTLPDIPIISRPWSQSQQETATPRRLQTETMVPSDVLLNKLEEVKQSVEKIELLVGGRRKG